MKTKRILSLLIALCMMLSLSAVSIGAEPDTSLIIIHTTDVHSRVTNYVAFASMVNNIRSTGKNVLLIDSGDVFHGMPFANLERGGSIASIMKEIDYDVMTTGNHDYNFGIKANTEQPMKL